MKCSCGRWDVEEGSDLCAYCRADYEERQREQATADEEARQARLARWQQPMLR